MPVDYDEGKSDEGEEHIKKKPRQSLSSPSPSKVTHKIAKKIGRYKGKSVEQYDLATGAMIAQFDSAKDAGLTLKINPAAISSVRGKPHYNSAGGYGWRRPTACADTQLSAESTEAVVSLKGDIEGSEAIEEEIDDGLYCRCQGISTPDMVACDGTYCGFNCKGNGWYYYDCVGLTKETIPTEAWFCASCKEETNNMCAAFGEFLDPSATTDQPPPLKKQRKQPLNTTIRNITI